MAGWLAGSHAATPRGATMAVQTPSNNPGGQTGYLPKGSVPAAPCVLPLLRDVLSSADNSWDLQPRIGQIDDNDDVRAFSGSVVSWDAHVYFDGENPRSAEEALRLRFEVMELFPFLTVNRPYRTPIGPHPCAMWSCELHTPDQLAAFLPWLCTHNGSLSVLVHPNTGNAYDDHSANCYWLGTPAALRLSMMKPTL